MAEIRTSVTNLEDDKVRLEAQVPAAEVKKQVDSTIRSLGRDVKIPGFRAGKIPRQVIVSRFGLEAVMSQALQDALPGWYEQAVMQANIKPVGQPDIEFDEIEDEDSDYTFSAEISIPPRPKVGKYTGLEVEKDVAEVKDDEVEAQIDDMRRRVAALRTVEGRACASGDFVVIDFTGSVEGEPLEGGAAKDYMIELGSGTFIPGFEEQIEGMEQGQSKKLTLTFPEDYRPEDLAGREVVFDVEMKEIKERELPGADDDFASENSEFDTIAELREDIRSRFLKAREDAAEQVFRARVVSRVAADAEVEIPDPMIDSRAHELEIDFINQLQSRGLTADDYMSQPDEEREKFRERFREQAVASVRQELVLNAIADIEEIEVGDGEVEQEIRETAEYTGQDPEKLIEKTRESHHLETIREGLRRRKVMDLLAGKAIPVLKKAGQDAGEEKEEEPKKIITP
ncbi:MAG: trigger factor [Gaiellales bacterium]|nr:MAG: trigger factor [Gaiellales bacterium]